MAASHEVPADSPLATAHPPELPVLEGGGTQCPLESQTSGATQSVADPQLVLQ
jgi:hypothetical protein